MSSSSHVVSAATTDQNLSDPKTSTETSSEVSPTKHYAAASIVSLESGPKTTERDTTSKIGSSPQSSVEPRNALRPTEPSSPPLPQVSRAQFTSGIQAREPVDTVKKTFYSDGMKSKRLYYFTELRGMKGDSITHRWNHEGQTVANVTFNINGDRWRVYSSKNLPSSMKGQWNVVVTDANGNALVSDSFVYD